MNIFFNELILADCLKAPTHWLVSNCRAIHAGICTDDPMENTILVFNQNSSWHVVNAQQSFFYSYLFTCIILFQVFILNKIKTINSNRGYKEICTKYLTKHLHMAEWAWHNKSGPVSWVTDVCSLPMVSGTEIHGLQQCSVSALRGACVHAQAAARQTWLRWWMDNQ